MGFLRSEWCFCGHSCDGPGGSDRIRVGVLSNRGAVVSINSTGTGILIHRALILTTHGNLPSITAAEDSEILVTRMGSVDSQDYRRKLAPERFFITNSVLDLTIVACDSTEIEVVQPLCLQNSVAPCLDFGRGVYLLGRQVTEEQENELMIGDGKITVCTDTLVKFSTDGVIWSPGSAGFDIHGNLAFMICDPMKLVSASQRKRSSATTFWRKDLPKQFGIPVAVIRHWLNQNWKGNIEELDRPRIPARLKARQKESTESSSNSIMLKRVHKENEESLDYSDSSEKDIFKHMGEDEEVTSTPVRPEDEVLDALSISCIEIQVEKNSNLTRPTLHEDLSFDRPIVRDREREISNGLTNHEEKGQPKKEFGECSTPVLQMEDCLKKEGFYVAYQGGPCEEDEYLEEKGIIVPCERQDAEGPSIMVHLKGPQKEDNVDVLCRESDPSHQKGKQKVSLPASEIEIENEKQEHYNNFEKTLCRETIHLQTGMIHKKNQQLLDIISPKLINEETIHIQSTEIQKGKHQLLEIKFPFKLEKDMGKGTIPSEVKDPMPSIPIKIGNVEQKIQAKGNLSSIQDEAAGPSHEHVRVCMKSSTFPPVGDPMSNTSVLEDLTEKKHRKQKSSYMKGIWKRTTPEVKESNVFREDEKDGKKSIVYPQVWEPMPIICIKPKYREENKQSGEKSTTLQEVLQKNNVECSESNFSDEHDQGRESLRNLVEVRRPISSHLHLDLNHEEQKHAEGDLSTKSKHIKATEGADISEDYQAAEFEIKGGCSDNGSEGDYGIRMSHISSLIHASSQRYTDSSDVETMYSAETRESRNYSPTERNGKKNSPQVRRTQSSISTVRGVQNWNCGERNSLPGRSKSAYHTRKNQVHPSCSRKISVKMPSYRGPDYFGPTVSSIMKKRNLDSINNNKGTFPQGSPRWIF